MDYSISDYHHNPQVPPPPPIPRRSSTRLSLQGSRANRKQSQYSLLDPNMPPRRKSISQSLHRRSSVAETEESYDPFRPSHTQNVKPPADQMTVTVLRGASQQTNRKPSTRVPSKSSSRRPPSIGKPHEVNGVYSILSSPPATRMHSAGMSQLQKLKADRGISRGSSRLTMASRRSNASGSSAVHGRKSTSYKRSVSFVHNHKHSSTGRHPRLRSQDHGPSQLTLQERFLKDQTRSEAPNQTQDLAESKILPTSPTVSRLPLCETPEPENLPILRSRKVPVGASEDPAMREPRVRSNYFRDDARKVSTEIEKLCDEAFNRPAISSSITTPRTTDTRNRGSANTYETVQSSTTSFSVHEDPVPLSVTHHKKAKEITLSYRHRPLPMTPATERRMDSEHLGSYTQRELAKTRDLLKRRAAESDMAPGYLDEVIAHLDRLMQPSAIRITDEERRAVSTPDPNSGIQRKDTFEQIMEKANVGYRSASEPTGRHKSRKGTTIRLVDSPSGLTPISPVKPLTIRKKSQSSAPSGEGSPREITPTERLVTTQDLYRQQERRSAGLAFMNNPNLGPIEEDEDKENFDPADRTRKGYLGESKRRGWFHRQPPPPVKESRASPECGLGDDPRDCKGKSDASSRKSQSTEPKKSGRGLFKKIFSGKRGRKDTRTDIGGDYDLDEGNSAATEDDTWVYNPAQAFMSGGLQNSSHVNIMNRGSKGSQDDKLVSASSTVPRVIQPHHQNWLARFLHIKPAVSVLCFQVSKVKARKEVSNVFREWRKYGMKDIVVDKVAGRVWARVDAKNCMLTFHSIHLYLFCSASSSSPGLQVIS